MNPIFLLEDEIRKYTNSKECVLVASGTAAIKTGLQSCEIKKNDIIVTTPFTFPHSAILKIGAKPLFVDIDEDMGIDPVQVTRAFNRYGSAKGVLAVHLFGDLCQIDALRVICKQHDKMLFEDASQAFGRRRRGRHAGTWGEFGAFSGYATKNFHMYQGGFIVTDSKEIADKARAIRNHGLIDGKMIYLGDNYMIGWNSAFHGWQNLLLHKIGIEAELGTQGPEKHRDIYSTLVYQHPWYQNNKKRWIKLDCPRAEAIAEAIGRG